MLPLGLHNTGDLLHPFYILMYSSRLRQILCGANKVPFADCVKRARHQSEKNVIKNLQTSHNSHFCRTETFHTAQSII